MSTQAEQQWLFNRFLGKDKTMSENASGEYVVIKALEDNVTVTGVTRGSENKFLHTEKLEEGEVWLAQFTDNISAMKVRGRAKIFTSHGELESGRR